VDSDCVGAAVVINGLEGEAIVAKLLVDTVRRAAFIGQSDRTAAVRIHFTGTMDRRGTRNVEVKVGGVIDVDRGVNRDPKDVFHAVVRASGDSAKNRSSRDWFNVAWGYTVVVNSA